MGKAKRAHLADIGVMGTLRFAHPTNKEALCNAPYLITGVISIGDRLPEITLPKGCHFTCKSTLLQHRKRAGSPLSNSCGTIKILRFECDLCKSDYNQTRRIRPSP
jgi:hypothetical protein